MVGTFGLERVHPDDQHAALEALAGLASGVEDDGEYEVFRFHHEDGHWVVVELITDARPLDLPGIAEGSFVAHGARRHRGARRPPRARAEQEAARAARVRRGPLRRCARLGDRPCGRGRARRDGRDTPAPTARRSSGSRDDGETAIRTHGATRPGSKFFVDAGVPLPSAASAAGATCCSTRRTCSSTPSTRSASGSPASGPRSATPVRPTAPSSRSRSCAPRR